MKSRIKWVLVGTGFSFGLQVIISVAFTALAFSVARGQTSVPEGPVSLAVLGLTLGAFLIGGFVVGWTEESLRVMDALVAALLTLGLNAFIYLELPKGNQGQFVSGAWLADKTGHLALTGHTWLFFALALIASAIGAYWGHHTVVPTDGAVTSIAVLLGLLGVVFGPFIMLAVVHDPTQPNKPGLPLPFLAIIFAILAVVVAAGYWLFTREPRRESKYEGRISISPQHH
ncbi:MAG TPA: hypothetical protein VEZ90_04145 [Blastocatellia bacterium]|nr:hypothetical protein [Blastocatellia bacterium]